MKRFSYARFRITRCQFNHRVVPVILIFALQTGCASAPSTLPANDENTPVQIRRCEYLTVDGAKLYLLTRGEDRRAPVLLWLHGGPGGPERPLFRYFNGELENHFVVAYWDQRGAGRSFDPEADPHKLTVSRHVEDLDAVVDHLRKVLGQNKVVLVGHSWGTELGLLYVRRHPQKVSAYIGVAQMVSLLKAQQAQYDFVQAEAAERKDEATLADLRETGPPPDISFERQVAMQNLADRYGADFHKPPCKLCVIVWGMLSGLVTPWEFLSIHRGIHASLEAMTPELLSLDLERAIPSVDVPVFFFLGKYDRHIDSRLAADYFKALRAPFKQLVWFENSAHNLPFEEPELFNSRVVSVLQAVGIRSRNP